MKELSIEEKAKAYDHAMKVMEKYKDAKIMFTQDLKEEMFPELVESKDERIRKSLSAYFAKFKPNDMWDADFSSGDIVTWIEKQCEQKPTDEAKPKFKVGDTVKDPYGEVYHIIEVNNDSYKTDDGRFILFENEGAYSLWTIQDAKDGDVLVSSYNQPFLFKEVVCDEFGKVCCAYGGIDGSKKFIANTHEKKFWTESEGVEVATKEQRDFLFQKMKEAGYEWDAEKKELKKIEQKPAVAFKVGDYIICRNNEDTLYQITDSTPTGYMVKGNDGIIHSVTFEQLINCNAILCVIQKPKQEWSEEDERTRKAAIEACKYMVDNFENSTQRYEEALARLKKQRPSGCPEYCVMSNCSNCPYHPIVVKQNPSDVSKQEDIELTEFEDALYTTFSDIWQDYMLGKEINVVDFVREHSDELLKIANKQKPTEWSDEDEESILEICNYLDRIAREDEDNQATQLCVRELKDWLKSLKDRVQPQPKQEWSEEEKLRIDRIIDVLDWAEDRGRISYSDWEEYVIYVRSLRPQSNQSWYNLDNETQKEIVNYFEAIKEQEPTRIKTLNGWIDWLKSLRPQSQWKPSDEQMEALDDFIYAKYPNIEKYGAAVKTLYQDLKKL